MRHKFAVTLGNVNSGSPVEIDRLAEHGED